MDWELLLTACHERKKVRETKGILRRFMAIQFKYSSTFFFFTFPPDVANSFAVFEKSRKIIDCESIPFFRLTVSIYWVSWLLLLFRYHSHVCASHRSSWIIEQFTKLIWICPLSLYRFHHSNSFSFTHSTNQLPQKPNRIFNSVLREKLAASSIAHENLIVYYIFIHFFLDVECNLFVSFTNIDRVFIGVLWLQQSNKTQSAVSRIWNRVAVRFRWSCKKLL